jgi:hypothetical protein
MNTSIAIKPMTQRFAEQVEEFFQPYVTKDVKDSFVDKESYPKAEQLRDAINEAKLKQRLWDNLHALTGLQLFKGKSEATAHYIAHLNCQAAS